METADLTAAERRVWRAFPRGADVDLRRAGRTVRAEVIRALLLSGPAEDGEVAALRLAGARVSGRLDLRYASVEHPVRLRDCRFDNAPDLSGARLRQFDLSGSHLPGLDAEAVGADGVLALSGCQVRGPVRLAGARISGALFLDGARLDGEPALQLHHAAVADNVWAPGLIAHGEVRMTGARISGLLNLVDATLDNPGGTALNADTLEVGSNVDANRLTARGLVNLRGATVPAQFHLAHARLCDPGGTALRASSCTIGELWLRTEAVEGVVNLRRSRIEQLYITAEGVPGAVRLDGLVYGSLLPRLPAPERLRLLERDGDGYVPQAYEQLTAAYRRIGDDAAARTVQLARQRRQRALSPWHARVWGYVQDATVGYGFRPMRATVWLAALLLAGTAAFGLHHPPAYKPGEAPGFNPLAYTLDLLLPIIDFGQEKAFRPQGGYQWLSYLLVAAGWLLATTIVTGITRALNRQ